MKTSPRPKHVGESAIVAECFRNVLAPDPRAKFLTKRDLDWLHSMTLLAKEVSDRYAILKEAMPYVFVFGDASKILRPIKGKK